MRTDGFEGDRTNWGVWAGLSPYAVAGEMEPLPDKDSSISNPCAGKGDRPEYRA